MLEAVGAEVETVEVSLEEEEPVERHLGEVEEMAVDHRPGGAADDAPQILARVAPRAPVEQDVIEDDRPQRGVGDGAAEESAEERQETDSQQRTRLGGGEPGAPAGATGFAQRPEKQPQERGHDQPRVHPADAGVVAEEMEVGGAAPGPAGAAGPGARRRAGDVAPTH